MTGTRLHLGCFDQPVVGWVNTDITSHIRVARVPGAAALLHLVGKLDRERLQQHRAGVFREVRHLDVGRRFPFDDGFVEAIFSAHMLEHLPAPVAMNMVTECHRVLAPGGVMRTGVPDLDLAISRYDPEHPDPFLDTVYESRQQGKNRHHWMYNETSLRRLLLGVGFTSVVRCAYREGACPDLDLLDNRPDNTMFMEAFK